MGFLGVEMMLGWGTKEESREGKRKKHKNGLEHYV